MQAVWLLSLRDARREAIILDIFVTARLSNTFEHIAILWIPFIIGGSEEPMLSCLYLVYIELLQLFSGKW